ncbi:Myosin heavy chain, partial [Diplonema papillatum]
MRRTDHGTGLQLGLVVFASLAAGSHASTPSSDLCDDGCPAGYFYSNCTTSCVGCPLGFYCTGDLMSPAPCVAGTYGSAEKSTSDAGCLNCGVGFRCPTSSEYPIRCAYGYFAGEGEEDCTPCAAGYACNNGSNPSPCDQGYYSALLDEECHIVEAGYYSPNPTIRPERCLPGTYSLVQATNCTRCQAGYACPDFHTDATIYQCAAGQYSLAGAVECEDCPAGSYCPDRTDDLIIPCDAGYFSRRAEDNCTACPAGYECRQANRELFAPTSCPPGTYSIGAQEQCTVCPAGSYCPSTSVAQVFTCPNGTYTQEGEIACHSCSMNHRCPQSAVSASTPAADREIRCNLGEYAPTESISCTVCERGFMCPDLTLPLGGKTACPAGTYPAIGTTFAIQGATSCANCPLGSSCPSGFDAPERCQLGTYTSGTNGQNCIVCPAGSECPDPERDAAACPAGTWSYSGAPACLPCSAGYLCPAGGTTPTPAGMECPVGQYCPAGATVALLCPGGTYGNMTNGESANQACYDCPAGYYCAEGTAGISDSNRCPEGHYCPEGSADPAPCPAGTYSSSLGATTRAVCLLCPAGYYCPAGSPQYEARDCPIGFYCPEGTGAEYDNPCPPGTYSFFPRLENLLQCSECPAGHRCPLSGSNAPMECTVGTYQPLTGSIRCKPCEPGWACDQLGLVDSFVTACHPGHFCPRGTALPEQYPCPAGSYSFRTDLKRQQDCEICWRGFACPAGTGLSPNDEPLACSQGHYCPGVPSSGNQLEFLVASYIGERAGSTTEFPCPEGTYTNSTSLWSAAQCSRCPRNYYCIGAEAQPTALCNTGHYCPEGSATGTQEPCPAGTFNDQTGLGASSECQLCQPGYYCPEASAAMLECPAGFGACTTCESGYYCPLTTTTRDHKERLFRCPAGLFCENGTDRYPETAHNSCPAGYFCPSATPSPEPCPVGTYSPLTGRASVAECNVCDAGFYCAFDGMSNVTGECSPGFYCPAGSTGPTEVPCPPQTYRLQPRAESEDYCAVCPRGSFCPEGTAAPVPCERGYYCVEGSRTPEACPLGTFGNSTNLKDAKECTPCTAGYYCDGKGLSHPTGLCDPGYYCIARAYTSAPSGLPTGGLCPRGGYCPVGSSYPTACAEGTYNNMTGGSSQQDCTDCLPGYYCSGSNLPYPTGPCSAGYYCTGGAKMPTQFKTPAGHYTTPGQSSPIECPLGTFNSAPGQGECQACLAGAYCPERAMQQYLLCPAGSFCPAGSIIPESCPAGTYQPLQQQQNLTDCQFCSIGRYCELVNSSAPTGECTAGYYCLTACITSTCSAYSTLVSGAQEDFGGECPYGHYCGEGTGHPFACPAGTYKDEKLGKVECDPCPEGNWCDPTDYQSTYDPQPCYTGHYCPEGTSHDRMQDCPPGTYLDELGAENVTQCKYCKQGFFCPDDGQSAVDPVDTCFGGFYCTRGARGGAGDASDGSSVAGPCPAG